MLSPVAVLRISDTKAFIVDGMRWTPCPADISLAEAERLHRQMYASDYAKQKVVRSGPERFKSIAIKSKSRRNFGKDVYYHVLVYESGRVECDCPGFYYRRKCRHVEEVRNLSTALDYLKNGRKP